MALTVGQVCNVLGSEVGQADVPQHLQPGSAILFQQVAWCCRDLKLIRHAYACLSGSRCGCQWVFGLDRADAGARRKPDAGSN